MSPLGENEAGENNLQPAQEHQNNNEEHEVQQQRKQNIQIPAVKSKIKYRLQGEDEWTEAEVLGRGGKATGKNKFYVNVLNDQDKQKVGIHLDQLYFAVTMVKLARQKKIIPIQKRQMLYSYLPTTMGILRLSKPKRKNWQIGVTLRCTEKYMIMDNRLCLQDG